MAEQTLELRSHLEKRSIPTSPTTKLSSRHAHVERLTERADLCKLRQHDAVARTRTIIALLGASLSRCS